MTASPVVWERLPAAINALRVHDSAGRLNLPVERAYLCRMIMLRTRTQ